MTSSSVSSKGHEKNLWDSTSELLKTDPEWVERFNYFAFDEVLKQTDLDDKTRMMALLATLLGCQGIEVFKIMVLEALHVEISPVEIKEIVYQAVPYLGIGRVYPFIVAVNDIFKARGILLPLPEQARTTLEERLEKGVQAQVDIFGEGMKDFYQSGPLETRHINHWLAANCFGDYYTRQGLNYQQREILTFCYLAAQGGCEPQLKSHAAANMRIGNDKHFLITIVSACLPFIGYPRSLNAIRCIHEATNEKA